MVLCSGGNIHLFIQDYSRMGLWAWGQGCFPPPSPSICTHFALLTVFLFSSCLISLLLLTPSPCLPLFFHSSSSSLTSLTIPYNTPALYLPALHCTLPTPPSLWAGGVGQGGEAGGEFAFAMVWVMPRCRIHESTAHWPPRGWQQDAAGCSPSGEEGMTIQDCVALKNGLAPPGLTLTGSLFSPLTTVSHLIWFSHTGLLYLFSAAGQLESIPDSWIPSCGFS